MLQLPFERQFLSAEEALASAIEYAREHIDVRLVPEREHPLPQETGPEPQPRMSVLSA
jgi:hypothetical protein